jgi:hypothetical protein
MGQSSAERQRRYRLKVNTAVARLERELGASLEREVALTDEVKALKAEVAALRALERKPPKTQHVNVEEVTAPRRREVWTPKVR